MNDENLPYSPNAKFTPAGTDSNGESGSTEFPRVSGVYLAELAGYFGSISATAPADDSQRVYREFGQETIRDYLSQCPDAEQSWNEFAATWEKQGSLAGTEHRVIFDSATRLLTKINNYGFSSTIFDYLLSWLVK